MKLLSVLITVTALFGQYIGSPNATSTAGVGTFIQPQFSNVGVLPIDYNPTATLSDAQAAAQALANRTAYWMLQLNPIAAASTHIVVPPGAVVWAHSNIDMPISSSVFNTHYPMHVPWHNEITTSPYCYYDGIGACGICTPSASPFFCWTGGNTQLAPPGVEGVALSANPVILNHNPAMLDKFAQQLCIDYLDVQLAAQYIQFTSNTPVGVPGSSDTGVGVNNTDIGIALLELSGQSKFTPGTNITMVMGEEIMQPWYQNVYTAGAAYTKVPGTNDFQAYFKRKIPTLTGQSTIGAKTGTPPFEIIISSQIKSTGTSPVARHGFMMTPACLALYSMAPNANEDIQNNSGSGAIPAGSAIVGSTSSLNGFYSAIRYSTSPTSGSNYSFQVSPAWGFAVADNPGCVRFEY